MTITRAGSADLGDLFGAAGPLTVSYANTGNILFVHLDTNVASTGVTFNGVSLTNLYNTETVGSSLWYLRNPFIGTANIVVSYSAGGVFSEAVAVSYAGVDLGGFDATSNTKDGTSEANYSSTVATIADNCWGVGFAHSDDDNVDGVPNGTGVSGSFTSVVIAASFLNLAIGDTNGPVHPAGNLTMTSGSGGGTANIGNHFFVSLRPAFPMFAPWTQLAPLLAQ